jgi:pantoate kinase
VAEVENLTGLGDVCAQFHGGCLVKLVAGDPLAAEAMPVDPGVDIHYRYFSPIRTRDILADPERRQRINDAADVALAELAQLRQHPHLDLASVIRVSRGFALDSRLLAHDGVRAAVDQVEAGGGQASMIMLGNAVFSTIPFDGSTPTQLSARRAEVVA